MAEMSNAEVKAMESVAKALPLMQEGDLRFIDGVATGIAISRNMAKKDEAEDKELAAG